MSGRPRRFAHRSRPAGHHRFDALTTDAWYTLLYVRPAERSLLDQRRRRIWAEPLLRAGLSRPAAVRLLERRARWVKALEAKERTPPVPEQLDQLQRWAGRPLRLEPLEDALDAALLKARILPAPGAVRVIRELDRDGWPLAVVSNVLNESGHVARTVLERLGLLSRFRAVVLSCEHPWAKPAPEPFQLACRFLGTPPARTVHVGDLDYDVRGARAAGLGAWWYIGLRRYNGYLPAQVPRGSVAARDTVKSWSEVPERLGGPIHVESSLAARPSG